MTDTTERPNQTPASKIRTLGLIALGLIAGVGGTLLFRPQPKPPDQASQPPEAAPKQMYQCPMHLQIIQDHPGDCPICGMDLVPMEGVAQASQIEGHATVTIDLERQQLIGLRTEKVVEGPIQGEVRTTGRVAVDERRVRKINVKVEGFVEKLFVDFVGKPVAKGQALFSLYSPEFVSAQREYLLAKATQQSLAEGALKGSGTELLESARRRLAFWDVPPEALDQLDKEGVVQRNLTLRSPISGVVTAKNIVEGSRITPADIPFEITDLGNVWVLVDLFEAELTRAKVGSSAELTLQAYPGKVFKGKVAFVDPIMDAKTRTAKLRLEFPNPGGALKPEMFGEVILKQPGRNGLLIPLDAVLDSGTSKVVFIALGNGKFEPRQVEVGKTVGERIEIQSGLSEGEEVVTRANFLVDSESRLKAALAQMGQKSANPSSPQTDAAAHSGHKH